MRKDIIVECLLVCGLNRGQLARALGVSRTTVYNWQTGRVNIPKDKFHQIRMLIIIEKAQEMAENYN